MYVDHGISVSSDSGPRSALGSMSESMGPLTWGKKCVWLPRGRKNPLFTATNDDSSHTYSTIMTLSIKTEPWTKPDSERVRETRLDIRFQGGVPGMVWARSWRCGQPLEVSKAKPLFSSSNSLNLRGPGPLQILALQLDTTHLAPTSSGF